MKRCTKCGETKPLTEFYFSRSLRPNKDARHSHCKRCHNIATRRWQIMHPERAREINHQSEIRRRKVRNAASRAYYHAHSESMRQNTRRRSRALKDAAYAAYGGYECRCCGERERAFLCIDHIANDGYEHRKRVKASDLYFWLKTEGYPVGFQILCMNCNQGKKINGGVCPHQAQMKAIS